MHLSYSEVAGQYVKDGENDEMIQKFPGKYLNEKNAIILNCKDPTKFAEVYEKAIERHFKKVMDPRYSVQKVKEEFNDIAQSMGHMDDEEFKDAYD
jgi:hypothetical protein